jgi:hypothetical protein
MDEESFVETVRAGIRRANARMKALFWISAQGADDQGRKQTVFIFISADTDASEKARKVLGEAGLLHGVDLGRLGKAN